MKKDEEVKTKIMNLKTPINENYAGIITKIKNVVSLDNCENVVHSPIFGNLVVVSKDTKIDDIGIFFPVETRLSEEYLHENNLYRNNTLNKNIDEKGYFEENGRIKCVKFRGHKSEGLFMPLSSLLFAAEDFDLATLKEGDTFDHINGIKICEKYVIEIKNTPGMPGSKTTSKKVKTSRIVENQFHFHPDTPMLGKNMHKIKPTSLIHISNKIHGTSFIASKILCNRKLTVIENISKFFGAKIEDKKYDLIYSSRKVIKNDDPDKNYQHYYDEDVWKIASLAVLPYLINGMTVYGEIGGYTPSGAFIQKGYDYGCDKKELKIFIYRVTITNNEGKVIEFSAKQVQDWCKANGLNAVPEYFYGFARDLYSEYDVRGIKLNEDAWLGGLLDILLKSYNMEEDCELCKNKVPAEGIVVRIEGEDYNAYKLKTFRFRERESKELDKGEIDIESLESQ